MRLKRISIVPLGAALIALIHCTALSQARAQPAPVVSASNGSFPSPVPASTPVVPTMPAEPQGLTPALTQPGWHCPSSCDLKSYSTVIETVGLLTANANPRCVDKQRDTAPVEYLKQCMNSCRQYSCLLVYAYDRSKDCYSAKKLLQEVNDNFQVCLHNPPADFTLDDKKGATEILYKTQARLRARDRRFKTGIGLSVVGGLGFLTTTTLMSLSATNKLLLLNSDCGSQSGVVGDPCRSNFATPAVQALFSTGMLASSGILVSGIALIVKFKD